MNLAEILPDKDFGLRMRFGKGDPAAFFNPSDNNSRILAERRKWITQNPHTCLALLPEAEPLLEETLALAHTLGSLPPDITPDTFSQRPPIARCQLLGEHSEADFLFLKPDDAGVFRLYGGCLCFPSHWDLREKLSQRLADIHAPVPGLNETLGRQIDNFLRAIKPGISWERTNWGLSRSPELNLHPSRIIPRLDSEVPLHEVWFRLEEQSLIALPRSGGVLFSIRLKILPLQEIKGQPTARQGMIRALETMPEEVATYKDMATARHRLLELIKQD